MRNGLMVIYLYQRFFYNGATYYWHAEIDYLPPKEAVFTPVFGDCGYYSIERIIIINHGVKAAFVYLEPLRITMPYSP